MDKIGYIDELGCVEVVFGSDVIGVMRRVEEGFSEYDIEEVSKVESK